MGIDHIFKGGTFDGWTVGAKYINRKLRNPIEDSVIDTAYAGYSILWNPKPGAVSYTPSPVLDDALNPHLSGGKIRFTAAENLFKEAYNDYDAFVVTGEKKSGAWYFSGSYTWSKLFGTYEGLGQSSNGQADALITSTFDYWPYVGEGLLPIDRTHIVKAFGSYTVDLFGNPLTIGLSGVMQYGTPRASSMTELPLAILPWILVATITPSPSSDSMALKVVRLATLPSICCWITVINTWAIVFRLM